jgi:hypothetical protein
MFTLCVMFTLCFMFGVVAEAAAEVAAAHLAQAKMRGEGGLEEERQWIAR